MRCRSSKPMASKTSMCGDSVTLGSFRSGQSAGGHLALTTAMLPNNSDFDRECFGAEDLKVAAVVNWYGITDVAVVEKRMQGRDHPVLMTVPETYYLKCFILRRIA